MLKACALLCPICSWWTNKLHSNVINVSGKFGLHLLVMNISEMMTISLITSNTFFLANLAGTSLVLTPSWAFPELHTWRKPRTFSYSVELVLLWASSSPCQSPPSIVQGPSSSHLDYCSSFLNGHLFPVSFLIATRFIYLKHWLAQPQQPRNWNSPGRVWTIIHWWEFKIE